MGQKIKTWFTLLLKDWKSTWSLVLTLGTIVTLIVNRETRLHALEANCLAIEKANSKQDERICAIEIGLGNLQDTLIIVTNDMSHVRIGMDALNSNVLRFMKPVF